MDGGFQHSAGMFLTCSPFLLRTAANGRQGADCTTVHKGNLLRCCWGSETELERVKGIEPSSRYTTRFLRFFNEFFLQTRIHWGISILGFILSF